MFIGSPIPGIPLGAFILKSGRATFPEIDVENRTFTDVEKDFVIALWWDEKSNRARSAFFTTENLGRSFEYACEDMTAINIPEW